MLKDDYKKKLTESIPVLVHLGINIVDITRNSCTIEAPLDKNINYEGTAFGGSINTVGILSCYLMTHHLLRSRELPIKSLVIQDSNIKYIKPVDGDFFAKCEISDPAIVEKFTTSLNRKKMARVALESIIYRETDQGKKVCAKFSGRFVATI